ncbi:DNA mismatch repair endonuclease MutL [Legionella israelensis]|uniref:DNA mismatch repair protein MutL n=1 Tax=Legionella israelensis TaxID=454 RepID=A0AAX1EE45_9GAMM|nr:DNA mismatch repair endonuclease MutL [Legionella israelensis]QBR83295.1 DNA mismatch repair endonuclease MutL [Legionella israelensis]
MGIRIKELPLAVANQIAAGEVIERPASVVKELLENAYDAEASQVSIEIRHGGLNQIKVIDNGVGIVADDLPLTIKAHATSKIQDIHDLYSIASMGFRGEALASIASVSKIAISSKTKEQLHAMTLEAEGSKVRLSVCPRNNGTTIDVRDLFYNLPVRKKFLKSERLEFLAIEAVVRRFAMGAPYIALLFKHNGKTVLNLPAASHAQAQQKRMARLFGHRFMKDAVYIDVEDSGMHLYGWLSGLQYQRSQNDRQWVYINRRMVKDKLILHAIKQVYEEVLHPGRFPSCLLYFHLPASEVDVNVHPAKHEIRFQQPRLVHDFFVSQLSKALASVYGDKTAVRQAIKTQAQSGVSENHGPSYKPLLTTSKLCVQEKTSPWIALNKRYALLLHQATPYLVDVLKLQQKRFYSRLKDMTHPFASRPLLVPVQLQILPEMYLLLAGKLEMMKDFGVHCHFSKQNELIVQALPVLMPQLDIHMFLQNLSEDCLSEPEKLLVMLSTCQAFDVQQLTIDEGDELYRFFLQLQACEAEALKLYRCLHEKDCQVLLGD